MKHRVHDPEVSWRNHQRVRFVTGFFKVCARVEEIHAEFEKHGSIGHDVVDELLESHLRDLKDLSHVLFRMPDTRKIDRRKQRLFDKVFGEMWHEMDKARDNIRLLEAYADSPGGEGVDGDAVPDLKPIKQLRGQVLTAAKNDLPRQLRRAKRMVHALVPLFEQILPVYRDNDIILRSLYFSRNDLDPYCHPSAVEYFFPILWGSVGKGYLALVRSLVRTRHFERAQEVVAEFKSWCGKTGRESDSLRKAERETGVAPGGSGGLPPAAGGRAASRPDA